MMVVFGNFQGIFQDYFIFGSNLFYDEFISEFGLLCFYFVYLVIGEFVIFYVVIVGFIYCGEYISVKICEYYLESCMKQNIGFFDKFGVGEVIICIMVDINFIQEGILEKVGLMF